MFALVGTSEKGPKADMGKTRGRRLLHAMLGLSFFPPVYLTPALRKPSR
jgi:hypothetical protein